jgi:hypothetical protein
METIIFTPIEKTVKSASLKCDLKLHFVVPTNINFNAKDKKATVKVLSFKDDSVLNNLNEGGYPQAPLSMEVVVPLESLTDPHVQIQAYIVENIDKIASH